jgi:hypothetical protein
MGTETAIGRISISGSSHAAACALWACVAPGSSILVVSGMVAAEEVPIFQDLADWSVSSYLVGLRPDGRLDTLAIAAALADLKPHVVFLQRGPQCLVRPFQNNWKPGNMESCCTGRGAAGPPSNLPHPSAIRHSTSFSVEHQEGTDKSMQLRESLLGELKRGSSGVATSETQPFSRSSHEQACCLQLWEQQDHEAPGPHGQRRVISSPGLPADLQSTELSCSDGCSNTTGKGAVPQARGIVSLQDIISVKQVMQKHVCGSCRFVVDNSGGELLEAEEPGSLDGVDLSSGSLFGVLGGGIVTDGGYVAGRSSLVERACARLSAPGLSLDAGSVPGDTHRLLFQGVNFLLVKFWSTRSFCTPRSSSPHHNHPM